MTYDQLSITLLLLLTLIFFIWGRFRYDIVAISALVLASLLGIVPYEKMFAGFGHLATITVALVLIISYGITKSGAIENLSKIIAPIADRLSLHIFVIVSIAGVLSMFMNNIGALALLMPLAIESCRKNKRSPSVDLMPLSFGSILGGLVTLIGTPPNIIISSYRATISGVPFGFFDFSPVGGIIAIVGIIFLSTVGWRLVPVRKRQAGEESFEINSYIFEAKIDKDSKLIGKTVRELEDELVNEDIEIVSLVNKQQRYAVVPKKYVLDKNDILVLECTQKEVDKVFTKHSLVLIGADSDHKNIIHGKGTAIAEVVVAPNSKIDDKYVKDIKLSRYYNVNLLAVSRQGVSIKKRLRDLKFRVGDILLVHGDEEDIEVVANKLECYPLAARALDFGKRKLAIKTLLIFFSAVLLTAFGVLSLQVSFTLAIIAMVMINLIPVKELYTGIDWPVITLLAAMIPLGSAMEATGATDVIVKFLLSFISDGSTSLILAIILIFTMTLSDILNNAATAILMAPIAVKIASTLQYNPDPFLMAVAVGASCAFLTPFGHQNNALILGPGGYKFSDYWKVGLPLEILIVIVAIPAIQFFWPLLP